MKLLLNLSIIILLVTICSTKSEGERKNDISGEWIAPLGNETLLIHINKNGKWKWWDYKYAPPPKEPTQKGHWIIKNNTLTLTIDDSESCKIQPGMKFQFELRKIEKEKLTVFNPEVSKYEEEWKKKK
jgi:hypothetical protein